SYHMQYTHGISPATGLPFSPPLSFRILHRPLKEIRPKEKTSIVQGKCHLCKKWVAAEGVKQVDVKVCSSLCVWKHASSCHKTKTIPEETEIYYSKDKVFDQV
ncbi:hypothetical protein M422DRAFT_141058, partial [Sphaerobolus stellatus SS14]